MSLLFLTLSSLLLSTIAASPLAFPDNPTVSGTSQWTVQVTVGNSRFDIGDASDPSILKNVVQTACNGGGCDAGTPQTFSFNELENSGHSFKTSGQLVLSGNWDNSDPAIGQALVVAIQNTIASTMSCQTDKYTSCVVNREGVGIAEDCSPSTFQQCTVVNYLQATAYDPTGDQKGQITMNGSSTGVNGFDCHTFTDGFSGDFGILAVGMPELGAIGPLLTLLCDVA
jgi:hypothetical protein